MFPKYKCVIRIWSQAALQARKQTGTYINLVLARRFDKSSSFLSTSYRPWRVWVRISWALGIFSKRTRNRMVIFDHFFGAGLAYKRFMLPEMGTPAGSCLTTIQLLRPGGFISSTISLIFPILVFIPCLGMKKQIQVPSMWIYQYVLKLLSPTWCFWNLHLVLQNREYQKQNGLLSSLWILAVELTRIL